MMSSIAQPLVNPLKKLSFYKIFQIPGIGDSLVRFHLSKTKVNAVAAGHSQLSVLLRLIHLLSMDHSIA